MNMGIEGELKAEIESEVTKSRSLKKIWFIRLLLALFILLVVFLCIFYFNSSEQVFEGTFI